MAAHTDRELLAEEQRLTEATRHLDVDTLDRIYADDIIFTGVTGAICNKASLMDEARRGAAERTAGGSKPQTNAAIVSYDKDEILAIRHGDTGIASFRFGVTIRADDKEITRRYRTTNVWIKRAAGWQVVAAHTASLG
jgi:ketosteroid isomerase-like protein